MYDLEKGQRILANVSEQVMEEINNAKTLSAHLSILTEERLY
jgi:hypothetical protein